jgi:hypothetical protein
MAAFTNLDAATERVDRSLEGLVKQVRVTDRTDISRSALLKLIAKRALRDSAQRLQRTERGDVSHFAANEG